jgi:hypothetical protein
MRRGAVRKSRPDFLIWLNDGTMLVVEMKRQDSQEKPDGTGVSGRVGQESLKTARRSESGKPGASRESFRQVAMDRRIPDSHCGPRLLRNFKGD